MTDHQQPLRVAVLFDTAGFQRSLPLTGAAARTLHLNRHLATLGVEVTLLLCDLNPRSRPTDGWPFPVRYMPYEAVYENTADLTAQVKELDPDVLVMANTQLVVRYGRALADAAGAALVYEMHDDEAAVARTIGSAEWEGRQAAVLQAAAVAVADTVVTFTGRDADLAAGLRAAAVHVVPCGVEPGPPHRDRPFATGSTAFIGNLYYEPNARAAGFLRRQLAPALAARGGAVDVYGRYPRTLRSLGEGSVLRLHGPVPDLQAALSTAQVGLAPLDSGGGMKLKVLQYMAAGLPVVGTPEAFAGLPEPSTFALVSRHPTMDDLPSLVTRLQDDPGLQHRLGAEGHRLVETTFSWASAARAALYAYRVASHSPATTRTPPAGHVRQLAAQTPYWLHEWQTRQGPSDGKARTSFDHPMLARLASQIDCARQAAESALDTVFDQDAVVDYGGRSMTFPAKDSVLKIYTHRPARRAARELAGLRLAGKAPGLRLPEVIGHDIVAGALAWVVSQRLDGTRPADHHDNDETSALGRVAARLHSLPVGDLVDLQWFGRNIRPCDTGRHPARERLAAVLDTIGTSPAGACVTGFVHGHLTARSVVLSPGRRPGLIDFESCGVGCVYEDLATLYVQSCLIEGRDSDLLLIAYQDESALLGNAVDVDTPHLLWHSARYIRWVLQWATEIDVDLANKITALTPGVLDALETDGTTQP